MWATSKIFNPIFPLGGLSGTSFLHFFLFSTSPWKVSIPVTTVSSACALVEGVFSPGADYCPTNELANFPLTLLLLFTWVLTDFLKANAVDKTLQRWGTVKLHFEMSFRGVIWLFRIMLSVILRWLSREQQHPNETKRLIFTSKCVLFRFVVRLFKNPSD